MSNQLTQCVLTLIALCVGAIARAQAPASDRPKAEGCVLWLRADAGVVTSTDGKVSKWADQSGRGHDLDQLEGHGIRCVPGLNGKPVVRFNGTGSLHGTFDFADATTGHYTILLVARWTSGTAADCGTVLSGQTGNWKFGYLDGDDQSWVADNWVYQKDWNVYGAGNLNADWHVHTGTISAGAAARTRFWKDDLELMDRARGASAAGPHQIALGGPKFSKCEVAELRLFDRALSPAELNPLWKELSDKYHISSPATTVPGNPPETFHSNPAFPIEDGPFKPDWRSLKQYECPQWFRDAKFGIWAHWSPQCQPEQGDWYAQHMYQQGSPQNAYHVAHYGPPSTFGYKDICNAWNADKWDPEAMIRLYKRAGAKYFVALANHHDNFDCWNSSFQPWNSVNVGPKKDIVGGWAEVARKNGLRFGVSVHSARSWDWFEPAHQSDATGPLKGVPYDGALTRADGKGKWWEGLDPADLYGPHGAARTPEARQRWIHTWFERTKDLVDQYHPDLLYFDDTVPPLGDAGMSVVAHFLNSDLKRHGGTLQAVYNTKIYDLEPPADLYKALVDDYEGGHADTIQPYPWQTDTCIGNWHYLRGAHYRTAESVVRELVDVVSKNGNLLLNIPVRGDGTLDEQELAFIADLTRWMDVNGPAIFGTRPWKTFKDDPISPAAADPAHAPPDIRFTTKGDELFAFALAWPADRRLLIHALNSTAGRVRGVQLLGRQGEVTWRQSHKGLEVELPAEKPCDYAYALKIIGL